MPKGADDLFKNLREHSIAEFFRKNKHMLGYSGKIKSLTTAVHEVVTNSLDACEESDVLPDITVRVKEDMDTISIGCRDNGPGIPKKHISSVFGQMLAGTKFHRNIQLRGQQGIGVSGVTMFSQMTTGKPLVVNSTTQNDAWKFNLMIDIQKNKAEIVSQEQIERNGTGVEIIAQLKDVQYSTGDQGPYEYLRRTALANPHTEITFISPTNDRVTFNRTTDELPNAPIEVQPHPKGVTVDDLVLMSKGTKARSIKGFLQTELARMSSRKAHEVQQYVDFDINDNVRKLNWERAEHIVKAFKKMKFLAPATDCLRPIGETNIENAMRAILSPEFLSVLERRPTIYGGGYAFQVEVGVAYGGHGGRRLSTGERKYEIMRFANRVPLLFDQGGCAITKAVQSIDWNRYGLRDIENQPVSIFVNLISTHIPYVSAGKQAVADIKEIVEEIRFALMDVGRRFSLYHSKKRRAKEHVVRKERLMRYVEEIAPALSELISVPADKVKGAWTSLVESKIETVEEEPEEENGEESKEEDMGENNSVEETEKKDSSMSDYM